MRSWPIIRTVILLLLYLCVSASANWYPGTIHAHSTFSDGDRPPTILEGTAIFHHCAFLIVTDHFEQIAKERKLTGIISDDYGFDKYLADFQSRPELIIIAGAEISVARKDATSHVLAIGDLRPIIDQTGQSSRAILEGLGQNGILAVAAHPYHKSITSNFIFDSALAPYINGIELFNESQAAQRKTLKWYLEEVAGGRDIFVTAGCDSHASGDPTDLQRWNRKTYVWVDGFLTAGSLFEALKAGRTYAAQNGVWLTDLNYLPGFQSQEVSRPQFSFVVHCDHRMRQSKQVRIYRDGNPQPAEVMRLAAGKTEYLCLWEDRQVSQGQHRYILEVENCLITSPIVLAVTSPSQDEVQKTRLTPAEAFFLGAWVDEDRWKTVSLKFTPGFFDLEYEDRSLTAGITSPKQLTIRQGTWRYERYRVAGTGIGNDGNEWTLDAWQDSPIRIGFSIIRQKPNFMGFFSWPYRGEQ